MVEFFRALNRYYLHIGETSFDTMILNSMIISLCHVWANYLKENDRVLGKTSEKSISYSNTVMLGMLGMRIAQYSLYRIEQFGSTNGIA